jgi:hypothetical protein
MKATRMAVSGFFCIAIVFLFLHGANAAVMDKTISTGQIRIHYPDSTPASCEAILIGVGTSQSRDDYDYLSEELNEYGYIVVIVDHNPGDMVKTDATKFRNCALEVKANLVNWMSGTNCTHIAHWIMGGHSASGQAAQNAVSGNATLADAIFSIDPYDCSSTGNVNVPALYWGFDVTTCFVDKNKAAKAAYYRSTGKRVFQKVKKVYKWGPCGYSPLYFHCSFCEGHCLACTNCMTTPDYFFLDVANSVKKFIDAAFYGTWSKSNLSISSPTTPVTLYVDSDQP